MDELVSVVVPVYNMGMLLVRAMDSLLGQTCANFEIIIVDDGSTDGSGSVCDEQAVRDERILVIHKPNGGLSSARNFGIHEAIGSYIIFPDPDDWTEPEYLDTLIQLQKSYHTDLEICAHFVTDNTSSSVRTLGESERVLDRDEALDILMKRTGFCGFAWNKLYHLSLIRQNGLRFDEELGMAQDLQFAFLYLCLCERIAYSPKPMYHYYQEGGGVTTQMQLTKRKLSGLLTYRKIAELSHGRYPAVEASACGTIFNMSLHFLYLYLETNCDNKTLYAELHNNLRQNRRYFFSSDEFGILRRLQGRLAEINPRLAWRVRKILGGRLG